MSGSPSRYTVPNAQFRSIYRLNVVVQVLAESKSSSPLNSRTLIAGKTSAYASTFDIFLEKIFSVPGLFN